MHTLDIYYTKERTELLNERKKKKPKRRFRIRRKIKGENIYMENEYIKVMELIKESCDNQKFDTEKFEFYETRREKINIVLV